MLGINNVLALKILSSDKMLPWRRINFIFLACCGCLNFKSCPAWRPWTEYLSQAGSGLLSRICFRSEYCEAIKDNKHHLFKTKKENPIIKPSTHLWLIIIWKCLREQECKSKRKRFNFMIDLYHTSIIFP